MSLGRLLTAQQLAAELGVSRRQVYRWAAEHGLPAVNVGRALRFHEPTVQAWLTAQTTNGDDPCPDMTEAPGVGRLAGTTQAAASAT